MSFVTMKLIDYCLRYYKTAQKEIISKVVKLEAKLTAANKERADIFQQKKAILEKHL
jgi:hypothetical protein